ncbi:hypothetical protein J7S27_03000 [Carnobacteriaceae bacterium zg-C25]|nr:hypothetical protein J7S27_03000 [Carnobacteriaceae bacterium zg-C25]
MWKNKLSLVTLPFVLLFFLMLEGVLAVYYIGGLISPTFQMAIQLFSTAVFIIACYVKNVHLVPMILIMGIIYDMYYSPVLSFYTIPLIIVFLFVRYLSQKVKLTFLTIIGLLSIGNILYNCIVYIEAVVLGLNHTEFLTYLQQKVMPTLFFNLVLFFVMYIPLVKYINWLNGLVNQKN